MSKDHHRKQEDAKNEYHTKLDETERDHKQKQDTLRNEMENLRMEKDAKIRQLEHEKEVQRDAYERRINELEQTIKSNNIHWYINKFQDNNN